MGPALQAKELQRLWPHAEISATPPEWHKISPTTAPGQIYASIADLLIPLAPLEERQNTYVATTLLSKYNERSVGRSSGKRKRRVRSGAKSKRRKWGGGGRPRADYDSVDLDLFEP